MNQRAMELANHLHMRARTNETIRDGDPVDYEKIRQWAPMLREAGDMLMQVARAANSAPAVTCDHFPGQTACEWCHGTGAIDAPTSADDPSCPDCDGEGVGQ